MEFSLDENTGIYQIRSYSPGKIQVNDVIYTESLILSSEKLFSPWLVRTLNELDWQALEKFPNWELSILLLGTGQQLEWPKPAALAYLAQKKLSIEIMDTRAACRTFSVLTAEKRKVIAALIND